MIKIEFNKKIIKIYKECGIPVDIMGSSIFILFAFYENRIDLLDDFDDSNKEKRALILYYELQRLGLLESGDVDENEHFRLSEKGATLVEYTKQEFYNSTNTELNAEELLRYNKRQEVESWIDEYIELFPKGLYYGKLLREDKNNITIKMKWFVGEYDYQKDTIVEATKAYLKEQSLNMYQYCRKAKFFITKQEGRGDKTSDLSGWCEHILSGEYLEKDTNNNVKWMQE